MEWDILDRVTAEMERLRADLRTRAGRALTMVGAILGLVQFAILGNDVYQHDRTRFLGMIAWAGTLYWIVGPPLGVLSATQLPSDKKKLHLAKHVYLRYPLVVAFGCLVLQAVVIATATGLGSAAPGTLWGVLLILIFTDLALPFFLAYTKNPQKTTLELILGRLLLSALLIPSLTPLLAPNSMTNTEKVLGLWPLLALCVTVHLLVWNYVQFMRLQHQTRAFGRLRCAIVNGRLNAARAEAAHVALLNAMVRDDAWQLNGVPGLQQSSTTDGQPGAESPGQE